MPKIVKTVKSSSSTANAVSAGENALEALSLALGSSLTISDPGSDTSKRSYYILLDSIGFPGFCLNISLYDLGTNDPKISFVINTTTSSNIPNNDDVYTIDQPIHAVSNENIGYNPYTCVLFKDSENNTVSLSLHPGDTETEPNVESTNTEELIRRGSVKMFFAKDVNDDVLCGIGNINIGKLRTKTANLIPQINAVSNQKLLYNIGLPNYIHLTKMINYLSPGYPEMKGAYVAVIRPSDEGPYLNRTYYADGARWGYSGTWHLDVYPSGYPCYVSAYNPFVKY